MDTINIDDINSTLNMDIGNIYSDDNETSNFQLYLQDDDDENDDSISRVYDTNLTQNKDDSASNSPQRNFIYGTESAQCIISDNIDSSPRMCSTDLNTYGTNDTIPMSNSEVRGNIYQKLFFPNNILPFFWQILQFLKDFLAIEDQSTYDEEFEPHSPEHSFEETLENLLQQRETMLNFMDCKLADHVAQGILKFSNNISNY